MLHFRVLGVLCLMALWQPQLAYQDKPKAEAFKYRAKVLAHQRLVNERLMNEDFRCSVLHAASLMGSNATGARFDHSVATGADFRMAVLRDVSMKYCAAASANFEAADLSGSRLSYSGFSEAKFKGANLTRCELIHCVFRSADLRGVNLCGADLSHSLLSDRFDNTTTYDKHTKFPEGFDPVAKGLKLVDPTIGQSGARSNLNDGR